MTSAGGIFLFSVDLEDVRHGVVDGQQYREAVPDNAHRYLKWLRDKSFLCTFFVTGMVAEAYPSLISEITAEGHEVACHTNRHVGLDNFTPDDFRKDLEKNLSLLVRAGAREITGFRAPSYSLTPATEWVYNILAEYGIRYSSSVLAAKNPLYGWPGFGEEPCLVNGKIIEIPLSLGRIGPYHFPAAGGIYFRVLPYFIIRHSLKQILKTDKPLTAYFHPYDIDTEQEHFMHGGIGNNRFYNFLMYYNRKNVFPRLDRTLAYGFKIIPYVHYLTELNSGDGLRIYQTLNR